MNAIMSCPKGFICITGTCPSGSGKCQFKIREKQFDHYEKHGPAHKFYEIESACEVLSKPDLIFQGLKRGGHNDSFCYVGKPQNYGEGYAGAGWPGMVFLVCLTEDFTFYEWRWEKEDVEKSGFPLDSDARFETLVWKRS
jgi:hypothetical protein